jgi:hypothetical protein
MSGAGKRRGKMMNAYKSLVANPEGNRPLGRRRGRREDNIKMDVKAIVCRPDSSGSGQTPVRTR